MVKAHGYTDPIVLASSQELDQFVYVSIHLPSIFYHNWTLCGLNKETSA
ncbi:hypothetical protein [Bacillus thuringiensis]